MSGDSKESLQDRLAHARQAIARRGSGSAATPAVQSPLRPRRGLEDLPGIAAFEAQRDGVAAMGLASPYFHARHSANGASIRIDDRELLNFSGYNYLGLSGHPEVAGAAKAEAYRDAGLFVLPTLNENFAITVAEALAAGTPVIATKGAPWRGLECEGCGWWIDHGVEPLVATLAEAMDMERGVLRAKGAKGRAWMKRDFSWDRVAHDMLAVYGWLSSGSEMPGTVRLK